MNASGTRSDSTAAMGRGGGGACLVAVLTGAAGGRLRRRGRQRPRALDHRLARAKRYVAAGDRAYVIGAQDGGFAPMGWHIRGEMGGVWAHPIKLLDGYWFSVNGSWLPAATRFVSGAGYVRTRFPQTGGLGVKVTQFAPDGSPVVLVGLRFTNTSNNSRPLLLRMDSRSELMGAYPWGGTTPSAKELNGADTAAFDAGSGRLTYHEPGKPWFAVIGATHPPEAGKSGDSFWGPVPEADRPDYLEHGNGTGGRLRWSSAVPAHASRTLWIAVAGSDSSKAEAATALREALRNPAALLHEKVEDRVGLLERTQVSLPSRCGTSPATRRWCRAGRARRARPGGREGEVVGIGRADHRVERAFGAGDLVAHLVERRDHPVAPRLERPDVDRQLLEVGDRVLQQGVREAPARRPAAGR